MKIKTFPLFFFSTKYWYDLVLKFESARKPELENAMLKLKKNVK